MKIAEFKTLINAHKGQTLTAIFGRTMKTRKEVVQNVEKVSRVLVRGGIDFENIGIVQEMRENGQLPAENAGLSWGEWSEFPLHITHKGQDYARLYPAGGIFADAVPVVEYYIDGELATKEQVEPLCLKSEFGDKSKPPCFTIKAENLRGILL